MRAETYSIDQVFSRNCSMVIPYFQRAYVWKEENWDKFFNDIAQIAAADEDEREPYFLGSIILKSQRNNVQHYEVIDGQQRLTTIVMFMKAIYLVLGNNTLFLNGYTKTRYDINDPISPILEANHNDYATYMHIINMEIADPTPINDSKLAECFAYFVRRIIDARDNGFDNALISPRTLAQVFADYVRLILINVVEGENEQKIFETINHAGVKLTTGEMLKNYLFSADSIDEYKAGWKRVFEDGDNLKYWEGEQVSGRISEGQIENFFYRFMLIKMLEPSIKLQLDARAIKKYRKQADLFNNFRSLIEKLNLSKPGLRQEIVEYASLYMDSFPKNTLEESLQHQPSLKRLALLMTAQNMWTMTPYILYVLKNVTNVNEQIGIFSYMETYLLRRIICKSPSNNYSDMFSENLIGQGVNTEQGFKDYVNDAQNRGNLLMPSDVEVRNAMQSINLKRDASTLLYMIESKCNTAFTCDNVHRNAFNDFCIEEIMPTKASTDWPSAAGYESMRDILINTLGNFVMLREPLKGKEKKMAWSIKKDLMGAKADGINTSLLTQRNLTEWDEKSIERRNDYLASLVVDNWRI